MYKRQTKNFSRLSAKYYIRQQQDLGAVDGFIEEMLDGQKVVKVFCHEDAAIADFRKVNDALRQSANMASRYGNLLMPINANIGWLSYAFMAIVGAILALSLIHISSWIMEVTISSRPGVWSCSLRFSAN